MKLLKSIAVLMAGIMILGVLVGVGLQANSNQQADHASNSISLAQAQRLCAGNCQEYYSICTLRCRPGDYHYMVCEDACRLDYQACYRVCEPNLK